MALNQSNQGNPGTVSSSSVATALRSATSLTAGGTNALDLGLANYFVLTCGAGNTTLTFSNIADGATYTFSIVQDGVGSRLITWPATVKWAGGSGPTLSTGASKRDNVRFVSDGTSLFEISRALDVR